MGEEHTVKVKFIDPMAESHNVRVRLISGETRILLAKDFHWHEEGARSATAIIDGREVPIYRRAEPEWGNKWVEQAVVHDGTCIECERVSMLLNPVDPDYQTESEEQAYSPDHWERDEHGWPIVPEPGRMPPIWKE